MEYSDISDASDMELNNWTDMDLNNLDEILDKMELNHLDEILDREVEMRRTAPVEFTVTTSGLEQNTSPDLLTQAVQKANGE